MIINVLRYVCLACGTIQPDGYDGKADVIHDATCTERDQGWSDLPDHLAEESLAPHLKRE